MKKKKLLILFSALLLLACGGDGGGGDTPAPTNEYLNVANIDIAGNQTEVKLTIQASDNCDWVITYSDSWIRSITPTKGRGLQDVTIQLYENPKTSERTAVITVKNTSGTITRNPTITQLGNVESLSLSEASLAFSSSAESKQVSVTSNTHWTITGKTNWMTLSTETGDNNDVVTITVQENAGNERSAVLTFTGSEGKSESMTITQAGAVQTIIGVTAPQISNIGKHEAEASFTYNMESTATSCGICYSATGDPTVGKDPCVTETGLSKQGSVALKMENLASSTTYYVRGYVITAGGTQYSNSTSFTTESSYPGSSDNPTPSNK